MTTTSPVVRQPARHVWLVWQRAWSGRADDRHFSPHLLMVCSSLETALGLMMSDDTSSWTQQVLLDTPLDQAPSSE
jgi:hypothetical protein